jgi:hypothetical protein
MVADNSYTLSCHLLIPYSGKEKESSAKDTFHNMFNRHLGCSY